MKPRNPHVVAARKRNAGAHTSTDKKSGGKRGGSHISVVEQVLLEYSVEEEPTAQGPVDDDEE